MIRFALAPSTTFMQPIDIHQRELSSLEETAEFADRLAQALQGGEFLALDGDLGAGKTSFTRELTRALGCSRLANSPTFALFQKYRGGRWPVLHGDLYRLNSPEELEDLGWLEMLQEYSEGLVVLEWARRFPELLPADRLHLVWTLGEGEEQRLVSLEATGTSSRKLLEALR